MTGAWMRRQMLPVAGYCVIAAAFFYKLLAHFQSRILADDAFIRPGQSDAFNFLWTYWWDQKAVSAGASPLFCRWILPPTGADLRWHTQVILPAILTLPVRWCLGTVGGYNFMVLALLVGGACVVYLLLRDTFTIQPPVAFVAGTLFGFAPYFVFKAHAHVNLIGEVFWAGALSALLGAYLKPDFSTRRSVFFALCVWATFWTSFVEFTMLAVVAAIMVLVFEVGERAKGHGLPLTKRLLFFAPSLAGLVSLRPFLSNHATKILDVPVIMQVSPRDLFRFPRLSMLHAFGSSETFELWGTYLPFVLLGPAIYGAVLAIRSRTPGAKRLVAMALVALVFTVDAFRVPSTLVRALPFGEGFRVFARFLPFGLFFLSVLAALGLERLYARLGPIGRSALGFVICVGVVVEMVPVHLMPSPVRSLALTDEARSSLDHTRSLLIVPSGDYLSVLDTYQIDLNLPTIGISYLARQDPASKAERLRRFPKVYGSGRKAFDDEELLRELTKLHVGYVLFEEKKGLKVLPPGQAVAELDHELLWALPPTKAASGAAVGAHAARE